MRSSPYFVNPAVDMIFIGGLSIATALVFWGLHSTGRPLPGPQLAVGLAWIVNWPHFSASSYRLYHSKSNIAQYPVTSIAIPLLISVAVVGAILAPVTAGAALVKLYLLWSPFHFSGQSLGITLIYAHRTGMTISRFDRAALSAFFYASYFRLIFDQESATGYDSLGGLYFPLFGAPPYLATAAQILEILFLIGVLGVFLRHCVAAKGFLTPIVLLPALAQFFWFEVGTRVPAFNFLVPFFHSLQYLLIAWAMQLRERKAAGAAKPDRPFVLRETVRWWLLNAVGGAFLFWLLPTAARMAGVPAAAAVPILFSAVQLHHFFVDGVIWKLRNPRVGAPLLIDLDKLAMASPAQGRTAG